MKKLYQNINLNCSLQQSQDITENQCLSGLFSKNPDGTFTFEEVVPKIRDVRNAKLFDGQHLSLVRMKNGKIQIHFKLIDTITDPQQLADSIYLEITKALNSII